MFDKPRDPVVLIDADPWCYTLAAKHTTELFGSVYLDDEAACKDVLLDIASIEQRLGAHRVVLYLSDSTDNFRKDFLPSYKANRTGERPVLYQTIRDFILSLGSYFVEIQPRLEADDLIGIHHTYTYYNPKGHHPTVVVSPDKDMQTLPGWYSRGGADPIYISEWDARVYHLMQTLTGDPVDGYKGCPGVGPKKAEKLLTQALGIHPRSPKVPDVMSKEQRKACWEGIVHAYQAKDLTEEDALAQARAAFILWKDYYNFTTHGVTLWNPY